MGISRVKTGINGFDKLVSGGFPTGSTILITGSTGTGKTIFGMQFIYNGAARFGERGLYVTFEQKEEALENQGKLFGWNMGRLMKKGLLQILYLPVKEIDHETAKRILEKVKKDGIKRLVIDSISTLAINAPVYTFMDASDMIDISKGKQPALPTVTGDFLTKSFIYRFIDYLKNTDHFTTLIISEAPEKGEYLSRDTVSEFICDGVVHITFESMGGEFSRSLMVRKMRQTNNDEDIHPLEISDKEGLVVHTINK